MGGVWVTGQDPKGEKTNVVLQVATPVQLDLSGPNPSQVSRSKTDGATCTVASVVLVCTLTCRAYQTGRPTKGLHVYP